MIIRRGGDVRTHKGTYSQAGILTQKTVTEASRWKDVLLLLQSDRQTDTETDRHADRQTRRHADSVQGVHICMRGGVVP